MHRLQRIYAWLDQRLDLEPLREHARTKTVPRHRFDWAYFFGGLTLFFLVVQICTGILLLLYYRPTAEAAFESVQFVMTHVSFGWLIRSIHSWSANLMILAAFLHMFSVYFMKAYARPRELTWWTGCGLLGLALAFGFSGYLLPWNKLAFFATRVGTDMIGKTPFIGDWLLRVVRGGEDVTGATLTRFFGFHVAVLPLLLASMLLVHLLLIQRQGIHVPRRLEAEVKERRPMPFVPDFVLREMVVWLVGLAIIAALAAYLPWELGEKADPFASAPAGIRPEWYFLSVFETLKLIPGRVLGLEGELVGLGAIGAVGLAWLLVPVLDRRAARGEPSPWFTALGVTAVVYIVAMTLLSLFGVLP